MFVHACMHACMCDLQYPPPQVLKLISVDCPSPNIEKLSMPMILGECLLISSLPGKALRTLVDIARLAERFNMRSPSRAS